MTNPLLAFGPYVPPTIEPKLPDSPYFWLPVDASSSTAAQVDPLFNYIMWVNVISVPSAVSFKR